MVNYMKSLLETFEQTFFICYKFPLKNHLVKP